MRRFVAIVVLAALTGCGGEVAQVQIVLNADNSGTCVVTQLVNVSTLHQQGDGDIFAAASHRSETDMTVRIRNASFVTINSFRVADVTFTNDRLPESRTLTVTVPAHARAAWIQRLVPEEQIRRRYRELSESRPERSALPPPDVLAVFQIEVPGTITSQEVIGPSSGAVKTEGDEARGGKQAARLLIPPDFAKTVAPDTTVSWKINYKVK